MTPSPTPKSDPLAPYRAKRAADTTPEPFGGTERGGSGIFVVQKHAARRLHYDLRLEHDGVLLSWAVPAGISLDHEVKRFAAHTEDHPVEYAAFEGVIPAGEYGGGEMIVWDRGALTWDEDPDEGIAKGKLLFSLSGYKLHGQWTLVQMKKNPTEWLLIKKPDGWHRTEDDHEFNEQSILTGLTVEDLKTEDDRQERLREDLLAAGALERKVEVSSLNLMLARTAEAPFDDDAWLFEVKYDGYRLAAAKNGRTVSLRYRSGLDATAVFPEIASAIRRLPFDEFVIDGEVVVLDDDGTPSFGLLQKRGRLSNRRDIATAAANLPATFFGFDLVGFDGIDPRPVSLLNRKEALGEMMPRLGPLRFADHFVGIGEALFEQATALGFEGVMAKRADSRYVGGRSDQWLKIRAEKVGDFAIVGYTHPKGSREGIGALHVAAMRNGALTYAGRVGSGLSQATIKRLLALMDEQVTSTSQAAGAPQGNSDSVWVLPTLACTVRYKEITDAGSLRQPAFEGFGPLDLDEVAPLENDSHDAPAPSVIDARSSDPTNTDKVFWPDDGYTKGDLIDYYTAVADHLLPYLTDRPLVLDRYPDGINGKSFFQKNAPEFVPDWVRTEVVGDGDKTTTYFIVEDVESLRYLANLASIPLHVWASRMPNLESPDWCVLDLDPKEAPFTWVVTVAKAIKETCDAMGLPCYPKTSGRTGLHILVPMGHGATYDQQKLLGELIARVVESEVNDIATTVRNPSNREGKVYIDYLQNGRGKLIVSPYSVRPVEGATVSAPLRWSEVTRSLDVGRFTITSMPRRLASLRNDPMIGIFTDTPDIKNGLATLRADYSVHHRTVP
jgi:bifunctional non-homologous end joining protein LigD